jgi:IS5 family transposase
MGNNPSVKMMERLHKPVTWENREALLKQYHYSGQSYEGADAYCPSMLLRCMVLQKWFHIPSDPERENQINNRISFKKSLGLPFDKPFCDRLPTSRFRSRLSREAMIGINHEFLLQCFPRSLTINQGIAIGARLASGS